MSLVVKGHEPIVQPFLGTEFIHRDLTAAGKCSTAAQRRKFLGEWSYGISRVAGSYELTPIRERFGPPRVRMQDSIDHAPQRVGRTALVRMAGEHGRFSIA
jgi:hypothetical protein